MASVAFGPAAPQRQRQQRARKGQQHDPGLPTLGNVGRVDPAMSDGPGSSWDNGRGFALAGKAMRSGATHQLGWSASILSLFED